jgi:hypothetical protein
MAILLSRLINVFASIISEWSLLEDVCDIDTAFCNHELRIEFHELLGSQKVVITEPLVIVCEDDDSNETHLHKVVANWISKRHLKFRNYIFEDIHFFESIQTTTGVYDTSLSQTLHFTENDVLPLVIKSSLSDSWSGCEKELAKFINKSPLLCELRLNLSFTSIDTTLQRVDKTILKQLVFLSLSWEATMCDDIVWNVLSNSCISLRHVSIARCQFETPISDYFLDVTIIPFLRSNKNLEVFQCNTICISNKLLQSLCNIRTFKEISILGLSEDVVLSRGRQSKSSVSLETIGRLYAHCASTGSLLDLYISDALHIRNWSHDETPFGELSHAFHMGRSFYDSLSSSFYPTNEELCIFFRNLAVVSSAAVKLYWVSLQGFVDLSSCVIDQLSTSFPQLRKLRIVECGADFATIDDNPIERMCQKGFIEYIDFDGHCSYDNFEPFRVLNPTTHEQHDVKIRIKRGLHEDFVDFWCDKL